MPFRFHRLTIPEIIEIEPHAAAAARGFFMEIYKRSEFVAAGIDKIFVQANYSSSERGVLRGLHYQRPPHAQSKVIRVLSGEIVDVAVDLRPDSPDWPISSPTLSERDMKWPPFVLASAARS